MKAQLIYLSCFAEDSDLDFEEYTGYFSIGDDAMLIGCLNDVYGLAIDYDEFERTYLWIKQLTIDSYLFTNTNTRNAADLAAWSRNAYESEWLYAPGGHGELDAAEQRRTADNLWWSFYYHYNDAGGGIQIRPFRVKTHKPGRYELGQNIMLYFKERSEDTETAWQSVITSVQWTLHGGYVLACGGEDSRVMADCVRATKADKAIRELRSRCQALSGR